MSCTVPGEGDGDGLGVAEKAAAGELELEGAKELVINSGMDGELDATTADGGKLGAITAGTDELGETAATLRETIYCNYSGSSLQ